MGALDSVIQAISGWFSLEEEETILHELTCNDCGASFMTEAEMSDAVCDECGSTELEEEGKMYVGGGGVEGA